MRVMARADQEREADVSEGGRLGELYRLHAADGVRLAYLLSGSRALAEDLVQEAFVRMYGRFRDLRDPGAFQWYLRRTIVNLVRTHFRRVRVERAYLQARAQERQEPAEPPDPGMRQELWQALLALPERQRTAIVLRFYEDMSEGRIAEVMGCPAGTVKSLISRGKERLRTTVTRGE